MKMLEPELPWWVGEIVTCPRCGARGELERWDSDEVTMSDEGEWASHPCPAQCTYPDGDDVKITMVSLRKPSVPRRIKEGPSVVLTEAEEAALRRKMPAFPAGKVEDDGTEAE